MMMAIILVMLPTLLIGYLVDTEGKAALLQEKEKKLAAVLHLLDSALTDQFDRYTELPRQTRILALNQALSPITERITSAFPGVGAGYYHRQLDSIITYAPAAQYHNTVGVTIAQDHPGREVMSANTAMVWSGKQVRGDILNSMIPVVRHDQVVGYIWANELTEDIRQQAWNMDVKVLAVLVTGLLLSLLFIVWFSRRFSASIDTINHGLNDLGHNLNVRLPELDGEMGRVSRSINALAQTLSETQTLNDLIVNNAADGVIAIDRQGRVTTVNPAAEQITGYRRQELLGQPYETLFADPSFNSPILDTLRFGRVYHAWEITWPARDHAVELSVSTSQIHNAQGELIGALVIFSDLTARKEAQRRMAQTERLATLGELMAGVAHEVRNPLTAMRGYVQLLQKQSGDTPQGEYLTIVLNEIDAINKVIQQLLDFSKPRSHQWQRTSLNSLVEEALSLVKTSSIQARIHFTVELDATLPPLVADKELLRQVVLNLLINAIQAIAARGSITIRSRRDKPGYQSVCIEDDGCGIPRHNQKKIFDPFFTTKASGTGLGLALSQRIINAHQGDIHLSSTPGHTVFTLILPETQGDASHEPDIQHSDC